MIRAETTSAVGLQFYRVISIGIPIPAFSGLGGNIATLVFSHNGTLLASTGEDGKIHLWNMTEDKEQSDSPFIGHREQVLSLAFGEDDRELVSGGTDGSLMLWDLTALGTINRRITDLSGAYTTIFSPDGKTLFVGTYRNNVVLLDSSTGKKQAPLISMASYPLAPALPAPFAAIASLSVSGDGKRLAVGRADGTIIVWDLTKHTILPHFPVRYPLLNQPSQPPGRLTKVQLSANGRFLAAGGKGEAVVLWDVDRPEDVQTFPVHTYPALPIAMALSNDGKFLAASSCAILASPQKERCPVSEVIMWTVATKQATHFPSGVQEVFLDMAFSPDGGLLAASGLHGITLWNTTQPTNPAAPFTVNTAPSDEPELYYERIQFSPDGTQLLGSSEFAHRFAFALWNIADNMLFVQPFYMPTMKIGSIAFSPDPNRKQLVSIALHDQQDTLLLWDTDPSVWQTRGCNLAHRNLTAAEWGQFMNDGQQFTRVCAGLPFNT